MKDEIKEILDRAKNLKYKCDCCEEIAPEKYIMRDDKQNDNLIEAIYIIDRLLDYITNLQEENEKLKYNARSQVNDYFKDKYADEVLKNAKLQEENERLEKDLKTLWNVCWNNDTEMTSYQNEVFDNYYDMFHKNGGDE